MWLIGPAVVLAVGIALAPLVVAAQQSGKAPRIGMLLSGTLVDPDPRRRDVRRPVLVERDHVSDGVALEEFASCLRDRDPRHAGTVPVIGPIIGGMAERHDAGPQVRTLSRVDPNA